MIYFKRSQIDLEKNDSLAMPEEKFEQDKKTVHSSQKRRYHALDRDGLPMIGEKVVLIIKIQDLIEPLFPLH